MEISPDTSIPSLFSHFSMSSTVHRVQYDHLRLPAVPCAESLFGIVAIMMDMLINSGHGHGHGPDKMVMSSVMVLRTVTYNCSLKLHLQRITLRRNAAARRRRVGKLQFEKSTTILVKSRRAPINNLIILYPSIETPLSHNLIDR